jgi:lactose/L-arabinose transport system ATP-binding protein
MAGLELRNVRKSFGNVEVVCGVDLTVNAGEFVVFVGPSGCGKSTLLRMIAGLERVTSGNIIINGVDATRTDPAKRGIAMVFQSYALYPHMTVEENMGFGLEMAGMPKEERRAAVRKAAQTLNIESYLDRKPKELSGGQRQRVAIGRAIVRNPKIFLFDEPLSNLDAELRVRMRLEIAKLHARLGATMIYVTHDQAEAMTLASRIVVLRAGLVEQAGSPMSLYENPDNRFVAGFIGSPRMNFLAARLTGRNAAGEAIIAVPSLGGLSLCVRPRNPAAILPDALTLGIRPEHFRTESSAAALPVPFRVEAVEQFGNVSLLHSHGELGDGLVAEWRGPGRPAVGDSVPLFADAASCMLFDEAGARL